MAGEVGGTSGGENVPSSPKSKVKFLCSHGGRILPRPADGQLKYVGGETRVISLSRDIAFSELMKKLSELVDGDAVLKYQLTTEDLDALVSVKGDEDLKHMMDEYDRQESEGSPRLRTFLFPSKPIMIENHTALLEPHMLEQRYIDAINGIIRLSPKMQPQLQQHQHQILPPPMAMASSPMGSFSMSSACSSPKSASPEHSHRLTLSPPMPKVQSSPSICNLQQTYGRHLYPNYHQNPHHHAYQSSFSARAHHRGIRTPPPLSSPGRSESGSGRNSLMGTAGHAQIHYNNNNSTYPHSSNNSPRSSLQRQSGGGGGSGGFCGKCGLYDECPPYACSKNIDKAESLPRSPR